MRGGGGGGGVSTKTDVLHLRGRARDGAMRLQKIWQKRPGTHIFGNPPTTQQLLPFLFHPKMIPPPPRQIQSLIVFKICSWLRSCAAECGHLISLTRCNTNTSSDSDICKY